MSRAEKIRAAIRASLVHHQGACDYGDLIRQVSEETKSSTEYTQVILAKMCEELETIFSENGRLFIRNKEKQYA